MDPKPTRTYFYYSGEADELGNMKCEDGSVSVTWILDKALDLELEHHFELHFILTILASFASKQKNGGKNMMKRDKLR